MEGADDRAPPQQVARAGDASGPSDGQASDNAASQVFQGGRNRCGCYDRPALMRVASTEQRHQEAGVNEDVCGHSRSPRGASSCER